MTIEQGVEYAERALCAMNGAQVVRVNVLHTDGGEWAVEGRNVDQGGLMCFSDDAARGATALEALRAAVSLLTIQIGAFYPDLIDLKVEGEALLTG